MSTRSMVAPLALLSAFLLGVVAHDALATRALAHDDAFRREDALTFLRLYETQVRELQEQTTALEAQVRATNENGQSIRDALRDVSRACAK